MKTPRKRRLGRALMGGALATGSAVALAAGGCFAPPGPSATAEEIASLERFRFTAPSGEVSALRGSGPGDGPRVIFVHGTPGDAAGWADFLLQVPGGGEAVALDRPGFGASEPQGSLPALAEQAAAIVPLLGAPDEPRVVLVGHSLGAPIAAWVAAEHPERVAGLALIAGSMDPELERRRWFNHAAAWTSPLLPRALRNSNQEVWDFRAELEQLGERLGQVTAPVLILHGERDGLVPVANADYSAEALTAAASARTVRYPEAGHLLIWSEPQQSAVWTELDAWIAGLESR